MPAPSPAPRVNVAAPAQVSRSHRRIAFDIANAQRGGGVTLMRVDSSPLPDDNRKFYTIAGLTDPSRKIGWPIEVTAPGAYRVLVQYQVTDVQSKDPDGKDRKGSVSIAGQRLLFDIRSTGTLSRSKPAPVVTHSVGIVRFHRPGTYTLDISPIAAGAPLRRRSDTTRWDTIPRYASICSSPEFGWLLQGISMTYAALKLAGHPFCPTMSLLGKT